MMDVRHQIGVLSKVASAYLIPDNHVGRATVSSIAVAHEVDRMGGRSIACLNARGSQCPRIPTRSADGRGLRRRRVPGRLRRRSGLRARTGQLTVRSMIEYLRRFSDEHQGYAGEFRAGVTTRLQALPAWKGAADFLFVQVSFDLDQLLAWRDPLAFDGKVYAGVMVLPSTSMARKLVADIPEITVPQGWIDAVEHDRRAGVELACGLAQSIAGFLRRRPPDPGRELPRDCRPLGGTTALVAGNVSTGDRRV
jgi:methylenetetrahydrofolate reductase (NADPH)